MPRVFDVLVEDLNVCPTNAGSRTEDVNHSFMCSCLASASNSKYPYVYGDGVYTYYSDLCDAGVHAGVIDRNGGEVFFTMKGDQNGFVSVRRNGIRSSSSESVYPSFVFDMPMKYDLKVEDINMCPNSVSSYNVDIGNKFICDCSSSDSNEANPYVYGDGVYYYVSDLCPSAVHAGVISKSGGQIMFTINGEQTGFLGSTKNGITSRSSSSLGDSFTVSSPPSN